MFSPLTFFRNDRLNDIISRFSGVREQDLQRRPLHPGKPSIFRETIYFRNHLFFASKGQEGQAETKESSGFKSLQVRLTHPAVNPGANRWFQQSTPIHMLPPGGSICVQLT